MYFNLMSFKLSSLILIAFMAVALVSCGLDVGEDPPPPEEQSYDLGGGNFNCLIGLDTKIDRFFEAKMSSKEADTLMSCVAEAFKAFKTHIKDEEKDGYRPEELQAFFQRYYFPDRKIGKGVVEGAMSIKRLLQGGSLKNITPEEFDGLLETIKFIHSLVLEINPYMHVYNLDESKTVPPDTIEAAERTLISVARRIGERLSASGEDYLLDNFSDFLEEMQLFLNWGQHNPEKKSVGSVTSLVMAFKSAAVREPGNVVRTEEWPQFTVAMAKWYGLRMWYSYEVDKKNLLEGRGLDAITNFARKAFALIGEGIDSQPRQFISFKQLEELTEAAGELGLLPMGLTAESVISVTPLFVNRVFGDLQTPPFNRRSAGLTRQSLAQIQSEYYQFEGVQRLIQTKYFMGEGDENNEMGFLSGNWTSAQQDEFDRLLHSVPALYRDGDLRVFIVNSDVQERFGVKREHFYNLTVVNGIRTLVRLAIRGFSEEPARSQQMTGLTEKEVIHLIDAMRGVLFDLELMERSVPNTGSRNFLEAKVFTQGGLGMPEDDYQPGDSDISKLFTYGEGIVWIAYLMTGKTVNRRIYERLAPDEVCGVSSEVGVFGHKKLDYVCTKLEFKRAFIIESENIYGMQAFVKKETNNKTVVEMFEKLARVAVSESCNSNIEKLTYTHLGKVSMMMHYIESIMNRFDSSRDGILDFSEAKDAFPIYKGLLARVAKARGQNLDEEELQTLFRFILSNQRVPRTGYGFGAIFDRASWKICDWDLVGCDIELNRADVTNIFTEIISAADPNSCEGH